jgi:hypothetical protein
MMAKQPISSEPVRGEAAWRAEKQRIAANNEAAYARGRKEREVQSERAMKQRVADERRADSNLPLQPGRD